jgi:hypothetical protein
MYHEISLLAVYGLFVAGLAAAGYVVFRHVHKKATYESPLEANRAVRSARIAVLSSWAGMMVVATGFVVELPSWTGPAPWIAAIGLAAVGAAATFLAVYRVDRASPELSG